MVPRMARFWVDNRHRRLVEPFCGGLAVALGLRPERALLNDINPHAINFYRWLKRGLKVGPEIEFENSARLYYRQRSRFNDLIVHKQGSTIEAAALFYYLNRAGYNGLCRFNGDGLFNVPFGRYKRINYERDFSAYQAVFSNWKFTAEDFERIAIDAGDLVYADPPYDVEFTKYSKEDFTWDDQVRLAEWLSRKKAPVVLSNQATERIVQLYAKLGFNLEFLSAPRMINCTGDRTPAKEVLAFKGI